LVTFSPWKKKRNEYFKEHGIIWEHFIKMGHKIEMNGIKAIPRKDADDFQLLFFNREPELKPHLELHKGETFLDVGANVGYHTLKAATAYGDDVKIIAIEAHPETYKALCRNIAYNGFKNVIAINKAVSDKKGVITLYDNTNIDGYLNSGHSTILFEYKSKFENSKSLNVQSDSLDNILKENNIGNVDVLKWT
jgi:FkbM family methyltransferase